MDAVAHVELAKDVRVGVGLGARATATLPRWLAWLALVLSPLFLLGAGSVTGDEVDGGILGVPLLVGYLGLIVWIVATSITILRRPQPAIAEQATARLATE